MAIIDQYAQRARQTEGLFVRVQTGELHEGLCQFTISEPLVSPFDDRVSASLVAGTAHGTTRAARHPETAHEVGMSAPPSCESR